MSKTGETTGVKAYAGLELVAAELMDEQPSVAMQARARMRELIERGGLCLKPERKLVTREVDENDQRRWVS